MAMLGGVDFTRIELRNSTGAILIDFFEFTAREQNQIFVGYLQELDCPDKTLDNGTRKRFLRGRRMRIRIGYLADDWTVTTSNLGRTMQEFIVDIGNNIGVIRIKPHRDIANTYDVLLEGDFEPEYPWQKWLGWQGIMEFIGDEVIGDIDIAP